MAGGSAGEGEGADLLSRISLNCWKLLGHGQLASRCRSLELHRPAPRMRQPTRPARTARALLTLRGLIIRTLLPARSAERGPGGRVDRRCAATGNARHPLSRNETDDLLYVRPSPARTVSARKADDFAKRLSSLGVMSSGEEAYLRVLATLATARLPFECRRVPRWAGSTARRRQ